MTRCEARLRRRRNRRLVIFIILLILLAIVVVVRACSDESVPVVADISNAESLAPPVEPYSETVTKIEIGYIPMPELPVEEEVVELEPEPEPIEVHWQDFVGVSGSDVIIPEYGFTWADFDYVARKVAAECGGIYAESYEGHIAVAQCIKDRLESDEWPDNIYDVCVAGQFAEKFRGDMELYYNCYDAVWDVFYNGAVAFEEPVIYFLNPHKVPGTSAKWHRYLHYIGTIGNHEFFN